MRAVLLLAQITATTAYKNVLGKELEHCSGAGMALTGYTREGQCVDRYDDAGSHHICINMKSTSNGNFCDVTGQPNWCASAMRCDDGTGSYGAGECDVENWFASYLSRAGGCDKIQEIVCEATNMEAYIAYTKSAQHAERVPRARAASPRPSAMTRPRRRRRVLASRGSRRPPQGPCSRA
ncbi:DUF2237-containing protein [Aureococcus anophagefferens]|nr:DUF2237-containing protein [Aureococcus anophagefferens]